MNSAIIVAGGSGSRFSKKKPKQFFKINGREIFSISIETFLKHPKINEVIIVSHKDWKEYIQHQFPDCKIVLGGKRRQDSAYNGLCAVSSDSKNVLIHDAARPFISREIISNCLSQLELYEVCCPVIDVVDSLILSDCNHLTPLNRTQVHIVQTPQCFKTKIIKKVLNKNLEGTDELGMLLKLYPKTKIKLIPGDEKNKKITTQNDLKYFFKQ
mgnify:CR=1 FL=1|tara:strand:- start:136 stop:774 length:639 start_codon:yes stop_codon:yes gene_type:complete